MRKGLSFIFVVLFFAAMAVTCPNNDAHYKAISEEYVGKNVLSEALRFFGIGKIVDVNNYVIFSIGRYKTNSDVSGIVSVGVFGHVFTFKKDNFGEEVMRALNL